MTQFPPPRSILPSGQRQVNTLPNYARQILDCWYAEHQQHPYPSPEQKVELSRRTGLTLTQVRTWFANMRRRVKKRENATGKSSMSHKQFRKYKKGSSSGKKRKHTVIKEVPTPGMCINDGSQAPGVEKLKVSLNVDGGGQQLNRQRQPSAFQPVLPLKAKDEKLVTIDNAEDRSLNSSTCSQPYQDYWRHFQSLPQLSGREYDTYLNFQRYQEYELTTIPGSYNPLRGSYTFQPWPLTSSNSGYEQYYPLSPIYNMSPVFTSQRVAIASAPPVKRPSDKVTHPFSDNVLASIKADDSSCPASPEMTPTIVNLDKKAKQYELTYTSPLPGALPPSDLLSSVPHSLVEASKGSDNDEEMISLDRAACSSDTNLNEKKSKTDKPKSARQLIFNNTKLGQEPDTDGDIWRTKKHSDMESLEAARILITLPGRCIQSVGGIRVTK
ncbi:uncharacterized protein [Ptychodera flava]|uniref:uncharacterized protein n=1 Tax=Ptychodera flava TaxID=63121 RepID=UPI00396A1797